MSFNLEVSIEMSGRALGSDTTAVTFDNTKRALNPSDYDGATYYFEINAYNTDSSDRTAYLVNSAGTTQASIVVPSGGSAGNYRRLVSSSWSPAAGDNEYRLKLDGTTSADQLVVYPRIQIVQASATKTRLPFELLSSDSSSYGGGITHSPTAELLARNGAAVAHPASGDPRFAIFAYNSALWAGTSVSFEFEALAWRTGTSDCYVRLYRNSNGNSVSNAQLSVTATSPTIYRATVSGDSEWVSGNEYEADVHSTSGLTTVRAAYGALYVKITGITNARIFHSIGYGQPHGSGDGTGISEERHRYLYTSGNYTDPVTYWEITGNFTTYDGTMKPTFDHYGTNDGPGTTGDTEADDLDITSTKTRYLTAFSLTNTYRYGYGSKRPVGGAFTLYNVHLAIDLGGATPLALSLSDSIGTIQDQWLRILATTLELQISDALGKLEDGAVFDASDNLTLNLSDSLGKLEDELAHDLSVHLSLSLSDALGILEDALEIVSGRFFGDHIVLLVSIELDTGTEYLSTMEISAPGVQYQGKIIRFGMLSRSVEIPAGLARVADGSILVADTDQYFRELFGRTVPKGKAIEIRMLPVGGFVATSQRFYLGEIESVSLPEGAVEFHFTDKTFAFYEETIPNLGTVENFPELPEDSSQIFIPIIFGDVNSHFLGDEGALTCHQFDRDRKRYVVARHPVEEVSTVFRKAPDDEDWSIVSTGFSVTGEAKTIEGKSYTITYLDFASAQEAGTRIRADVKGWPAPGTAAASQNLAINLKLFLNEIAGQPDARLNLASFSILEEDFATLGWKMDGALTSEMTHRSAVSQIISSFNCDLYQDKNGRITASITPVSGNDATFDDVFHLLKDTIYQRMPGDAINKIPYKFGKDAEGNWKEKRVWEDLSSQATVGKILDRPFEYHFVRDVATAGDVTADIASYLSLQSHWIEFDLSAPRSVDLLELAHLVGITHYGGIGEGGYTDESFKVGQIDFDPNDLRYRVKAIRRVAPEPRQGAQLEDVAWSTHALAGPYVRSREFFGVFADYKSGPSQQKRMIVVYSNDYGRSWVRLDEENFPILTNTIGSYNSVMGEDDHLHVAIQEDVTGRVSYHAFSMSTRSWVLTDEEVLASNVQLSDPVHGYAGAGYSAHVTLCLTNPSRRVTVVFCQDGTAYDPADGTYLFEASTADDYRFRRMMITHRISAGSWSTPQRIGADAHNRCCSTSDWGGELVALQNDHVAYFYASLPGYSSASTPDFRAAIYTAGGSVGAQQTYLITSLVFYPAYGGTFGRIATSLEEDGQLRVHVTYKAGYGRAYFSEFLENKLLSGSYDAGTNLLDNKAEWTAYFVGTEGPFDAINESNGATGRTQGQIVVLGDGPAAYPSDDLYFFACYTPKMYNEELGYVKTGPSDTLGIQTSQQTVFRLGARIYVCAFFSNNSTDPYFCLFAEDELPLDAGYDLADFLAEFDL